MDRIDYEKMAINMLLNIDSVMSEPERRCEATNVLRAVATAAAEAQREACYDHTLQTFGCVETARIVRETKLITESEAK